MSYPTCSDCRGSLTCASAVCQNSSHIFRSNTKTQTPDLAPDCRESHDRTHKKVRTTVFMTGQVKGGPYWRLLLLLAMIVIEAGLKSHWWTLSLS